MTEEKQQLTYTLEEISKVIDHNPKRKEGESFEEYKQRRKATNMFTNLYLRGKNVIPKQ